MHGHILIVMASISHRPVLRLTGHTSSVSRFALPISFPYLLNAERLGITARSHGSDEGFTERKFKLSTDSEKN